MLLVKTHQHVDIEFVILADRGEERSAQLLALEVDAQRFEGCESCLQQTLGFSKISSITFYLREAAENVRFVEPVADISGDLQGLIERRKCVLRVAHVS